MDQRSRPYVGVILGRFPFLRLHLCVGLPLRCLGRVPLPRPSYLRIFRTAGAHDAGLSRIANRSPTSMATGAISPQSSRRCSSGHHHLDSPGQVRRCR